MIVIIFILIILAPEISGPHAENISTAVNQISYSYTRINGYHLLYIWATAGKFRDLNSFANVGRNT